MSEGGSVSELNIPLLRKMVEWVEEQEQLVEGREWRQWHWYSRIPHEGFCETTYCVAGKIAVDAGWKPYKANPYRCCERDGVVAGWPNAAQAELGLEDGGTVAAAGNLFAAHNSAADVRRIAEEIAGERL